MPIYFISKTSKTHPEDKNEVHQENCTNFPSHPLYLGSFKTCMQAVEFAKALGYGEFSCCSICCNDSAND